MTPSTRAACPTDGAIAELADRDGRVIITKDRDFRDGHVLGGTPKRLLVVATGNTTNAALLALFGAHIPEVASGEHPLDLRKGCGPGGPRYAVVDDGELIVRVVAVPARHPADDVEDLAESYERLAGGE